MAQLKLRVGQVTAEEMLPPLETLSEAAEDIGIRGARGERQYVDEKVLEDNFLYLEFRQEVTEERPQFTTEDAEEVEDEDTEEDSVVEVDETFVARKMRFILRDDPNREGRFYAFESTRGVYGEDAIEYLTEDMDITGLSCHRRETFPPDWIESFYESVNAVRKVKLDNISEFEVEELDDLSDLVSGLGGPAQLVQFSDSGQGNNLRDSDLVDAVTRVSRIKFVSGVDIEDNLQKLNRKGRLTISHPSDLNPEEQAERMYIATDNIIRQL